MSGHTDNCVMDWPGCVCERAGWVNESEDRWMECPMGGWMDGLVEGEWMGELMDG